MINNRIELLREKMLSNNIDAYIIPSSDPHQSEYAPTHWQSREWISGFTGSAGTVVVTQEHAGLWTDSRYFIQAEEELSNSEIKLHKIIDRSQPEHIVWLSENLKSTNTVAIDAPLFSVNQKNSYEKILSQRQIELKVTNDLISSIWSDRPKIPKTEIFNLELKFAGKSRRAKVNDVRSQMKNLDVGFHLITTLDDIAWLLNLRGRDVHCNPVFVSFMVITIQDCFLFINKSKVNNELKLQLDNDNITILPYDSINTYLKNLNTSDSILIDPSTINLSLKESLSNTNIINGKMPSQLAKAKKNEIEIDNIRKCMVKDGLALTHAFYSLEYTLKNGSIKEYEFANVIAKKRSEQNAYFGESFDAIVGYNGNGAIVHYHPTVENSSTITSDGILLVDSGGQYFDGTTDITRTIALSKPNDEQKNAYTRVLKGHIALDRAVFPYGTTGGQLDILARQYLWEDQLNFLHGTGHGVGFFLNVHEGPHSISPGQSLMTRHKIELGMLTSNEPGYYKANEYGIRIENLILTVNAEKEGFLKFETVTLFPIDTQLIDLNLMNSDEIKWLNDYHIKVYNSLSPHLEEKYRLWLKDKCQKI
jgi:Xaa-Pro aminopeptidase